MEVNDNVQEKILKRLVMSDSTHSAKRPRALILGSGDRKPELIPKFKGLRPDIERFVDIVQEDFSYQADLSNVCLLYTSPSPRDRTRSRMPSSA